MGREDYATTGGALKLKGVSSGSITKKKKRKTKKADNDATTETAPDATAISKPADRSTSADVNTSGPDREGSSKETDAILPSVDAMEGKTESERKFEEMRRKRLDQRLIKEGTKTHKERVDEFNKYLSNLSEHHDMPRIGPG